LSSIEKEIRVNHCWFYSNLPAIYWFHIMMKSPVIAQMTQLIGENTCLICQVFRLRSKVPASFTRCFDLTGKRGRIFLLRNKTKSDLRLLNFFKSGRKDQASQREINPPSSLCWDTRETFFLFTSENLLQSSIKLNFKSPRPACTSS